VERGSDGKVKDIIVVGASGYGREVFQYVKDIARQQPDIRPKGLLDDDLSLRSNPGGEEIIGDTTTYSIQEHDRFVISAGIPAVRHTLAERLASRGAQFITLIHPNAYVSPTARIGTGCIVSPFASVGSNAQLDDHILLVMYASVAHDCRIGSYCSLSPYAAAAGGVIVGSKVFFGSYAMVTPTKRIGQESKIAAGAVVYRDVPEQSLATGNPAKVLPLYEARVDLL
jgi:sugar O-acyltransferase (sialic acid O-acetyltransferase NeuD family)